MAGSTDTLNFDKFYVFSPEKNGQCEWYREIPAGIYAVGVAGPTTWAAVATDGSVVGDPVGVGRELDEMRARPGGEALDEVAEAVKKMVS